MTIRVCNEDSYLDAKVFLQEKLDHFRRTIAQTESDAAIANKYTGFGASVWKWIDEDGKWLAKKRSISSIMDKLKGHKGGFYIDKDKVFETENIKPFALVIDGRTLEYALEPECKLIFLELACLCKAVVCCRVSPLQKALVVSLVKQNVEGAITLAIGDGANDVGMIQAAHLGVGISGVEGLQAARSADIAIAQFKYLQKLLLVHGGWAYARLSKLVLYCFYKNITLYLIQFWFSFDNGFSGQTIFESWIQSCYNIAFTLLQPVALGIFDQFVSARMLDRSFLHSFIIYSLLKTATNESQMLSDGRVVNIWLIGVNLFTIDIILVTLKAVITLNTWTWFTRLAVIGSLVAWLVLFPIYGTVAPMINLSPEFNGKDLIGSTSEGNSLDRESTFRQLGNSVNNEANTPIGSGSVHASTVSVSVSVSASGREVALAAESEEIAATLTADAGVDVTATTRPSRIDSLASIASSASSASTNANTALSANPNANANANANANPTLSSKRNKPLQLPFFGKGSANKNQFILTGDGSIPVPIRSDGSRKRVHPTADQQALLESFFANNPMPSPVDRAIICEAVNINSRSVQVWFQNRRAKAKREAETGSSLPIKQTRSRRSQTDSESEETEISDDDDSEYQQFKQRKDSKKESAGSGSIGDGSIGGSRENLVSMQQHLQQQDLQQFNIDYSSSLSLMPGDSPVSPYSSNPTFFSSNSALQLQGLALSPSHDSMFVWGQTNANTTPQIQNNQFVLQPQLPQLQQSPQLNFIPNPFHSNQNFQQQSSTILTIPNDPNTDTASPTRIYVSELTIGTWRRVSTTSTDLMCHVWQQTGTLRWSILESGYTFCMDVILASVVDAAISPHESHERMSWLVLDICNPPSFLREVKTTGVNGASSNNTGGNGGSVVHEPQQFIPCSDFSENYQASTCTRHTIVGASEEVERLFLILSRYFDQLKQISGMPRTL
ncbi:hypothetical protein HK100_007966 [Physocladia obscura]|uniref:Homeobox domain-containing protein n=1 Tax=Physocladia obscura TaxID=109957 RepID=A0AAD5XI41_9FUNG|nr:hypothetical protein HK100_007966 [Physocladia obscura]